MLTAPDGWTNVGKWNWWYKKLTRKTPRPLGVPKTYRLAEAFLRDCATIEDWGCGPGYARSLFPTQRYRGIDGSNSPFADHVADLCEYRSSPDGILLRHVLEHEYRWRLILENAVASARRKLCIIGFVPFRDQDTLHHLAPGAYKGVPILHLSRPDFEHILRAGGWSFTTQVVPAGGQEFEEVFYCTR